LITKNIVENVAVKLLQLAVTELPQDVKKLSSGRTVKRKARLEKPS